MANYKLNFVLESNKTFILMVDLISQFAVGLLKTKRLYKSYHV